MRYIIIFLLCSFETSGLFFNEANLIDSKPGKIFFPASKHQINLIRISDKKLSSLLFVTDENESKIRIDSICKDSPKLILRVPNIYCTPCLVIELEYLNQFITKTNYKSVIVLTSFINFRTFISFKRANCKNIPCYNLETLETNIDKGNKEGLYYFILYPDLTIDNIFFSNKQIPKASKDYLHKISKNIFGVN